MVSYTSPMSDITKVKIWKILSSSNHFWITALILYLQFRGLTLSQALLIISLYSFLCVLLEYPTGVIGDYFSHKTSVMLGSLIGALMIFLFTFPGSYYYYLILIPILGSLSITLISGSDTALLHSVSKDFKKDLAQISPIALCLSAASISIGGLLASVDLRYPFYASFVYALISIPFLFNLKSYSHTKEDGNIFQIAKEGIKDVASNQNLKDLTIISSFFGAFFVSLKWFYNPLFEKLQIPVGYWGIITSTSFLLVALGAHIYRKNDKLSLSQTSALALIFIFTIGLTNFMFLPVAGIWLVHIVRGYQETHLGILVNNEITTSRRASILSLNSLLVRLFSSVYILAIGYLLPKTSFMAVLSFTVFIIGFIIFLPLRRLAKLEK
jgi:MFS family permease